MAITNGYATLAEIKDYLEITSSSHDTDLERSVEAASRKIDQFCGRIFYDTGSATAKTFRAWHPYELDVPDFSTTTGLIVQTDTSADGTYDETWTITTDFVVEPVGTHLGTVPYNRMVAVGARAFPTWGRRPRVQVTARWGWTAVPTDVEIVCLELAGELFKRKDAPFGVANFNEFGAVRVSGSDDRVLQRLDHYRRILVR